MAARNKLKPNLEFSGPGTTGHLPLRIFAHDWLGSGLLWGSFGWSISCRDTDEKSGLQSTPPRTGTDLLAE